MCNERQIQMSFFSPIHEDIKILKSNSNIIVLLKLYFYVADVAEWSWPLDMKLRNWCCSVSIVFEFESRRGGTKKCQFKNLILTRLVFIFREKRRVIYLLLRIITSLLFQYIPLIFLQNNFVAVF